MLSKILPMSVKEILIYQFIKASIVSLKCLKKKFNIVLILTARLEQINVFLNKFVNGSINGKFFW